jgi:HEAT repeat protein
LKADDSDAGRRPEDETGLETVEQSSEEETSFTQDIWRLFLIPAVIVALSVGVFVLFGQIASEGKSASEYLQEVRHGTSNRRWQAAFELSRILIRDEDARTDPSLVPEIMAILSDEQTEDPVIRRYLLLALEEIGDSRGAPAALAALGDEDVEVRLFAARALGRLGGGQPAAEELLMLLEEEDSGLRKIALHSLGLIGDQSAISRIVPRLDDSVEDVRWNAALSLAMLGDQSGIGILGQMMNPEYLGQVEGITESQKEEARLNAVRASFKLRDPGLRILIEGLSKTDPSLRVRNIALQVLEEWN